MQIESIRTRLESYEQRLNRELYLYYSGLKDQFELMSVYSDYSDLFSIDSIHELQSEIENTDVSFSSRRKSLAKIYQYMLDQRFDYRAGSLTQEIERFEARQTFLCERTTTSLSKVPDLLKNEEDALKRRMLGERSAAAFGEADELRQQKVIQLQTTAREVGFRDYVEAREYISGIDYRYLLHSLDAALSRLEDSYLERMRASVEATLGISLQDAGPWDIPRWRMLNDMEQVFPANRLLAAIKFFVSELGIQPEREDAISVDLCPNATGISTACCIPIRVPHEIKIVMRPDSGVKYYSALLHEMGHACHFAWTAASLPVEHRVWGDRAISESYAFLLEHFLMEPEWLVRVFSFTRSKEFLRFQSLYRAFLVRRCAGHLRFTLQLYAGDSFDNIPQMYAETMKAYTGFRYPAESWAAGLTDGSESADYLRGWILESLLREHVYTRYGKLPCRAASGFLKELWETGLLYSAEELCREIGVGNLDPRILADELFGGLQY